MSNQFIEVGGKQFEFAPGMGGVCYFADQVHEPDGKVTTEIRKCWFEVKNQYIRVQDARTGNMSGDMFHLQFLKSYAPSELEALELRVVALDEVAASMRKSLDDVCQRKAEAQAMIASHTQKALF